MSGETVLIIEDDPAMLMGLQDNFKMAGYTVRTSVDGEAGLTTALAEQPDLIILDLMLPKLNGYEICRSLRDEDIDVPIIMLTAKAEEEDLVLGLKLGADDYVTKPFSIKELLARAESFFRRRRKDQGRVHRFGDCRLDLTSRRLTRAGRDVALTPKEFELLTLFVKQAGRALTRDQILNAVWGYDISVTPRSIDRFVTMLRKKLEDDPRQPVFLQTVRGIGYRFEVLDTEGAKTDEESSSQGRKYRKRTGR